MTRNIKLIAAAKWKVFLAGFQQINHQLWRHIRVIIKMRAQKVKNIFDFEKFKRLEAYILANQIFDIVL